MVGTKRQLGACSQAVGGKNSLDAVKQWFLSGIVTKDEYANTLCQERYCVVIVR